jgi:hypothetical protein
VRDGTPAVEVDIESPLATGDRQSLDTHEIPLSLDRTQEVAGSSPASSTNGISLQRSRFRLKPSRSYSGPRW